MAVSILHRVTGGALTVAGLAVLTWWLLAVAGGSDSYGKFVGLASQWFGIAVLAGLTWAFFQHTLSGFRHLVMDTGENFEIRANKTSAIVTVAASLFLTALFWYLVLGVAK